MRMSRLNLAAQNVEVIRRRRAIGDLHIVFRTHLQIAFKTCRRMLRALTLVAMRQQTHEAGETKPFAFAGRYELVEHNLSAVGKVSELGFPHGQSVRLAERIAIFETEYRLFREHGVDHFVTGLVVADRIQRNVTIFGFLIDENRVTLRKGPALAVLP